MLLGGGSEVLGLDTDLSADHDWGPRVTLFVEASARLEAESIAADLPNSFREVSTRFGSTVGGAAGIHPFEVSTVGEYFDSWIGFHEPAQATVVDWLANPAMSFLAVTAGSVFHDGPTQLTAARKSVYFYPDDVWRWVVACQWRRIGEEQPFIERAALAGDMLGATVIAARVVGVAMRLALLLERRYPPYAKWLGSAFATLPVGRQLGPTLAAVVGSRTSDGPAALCEALEVLGSLTNDRLGVEVDPSRRRFFSRPFLVAPAGEFTAALLATVTDRQLKGLATSIGNVDMLFGTNNGSFPGARATYRELLRESSPLDPPTS